MRAIIQFGTEAQICISALCDLWKQEHARYYENNPCRLNSGEYAGFFRHPEKKEFGWRRSSGATATVGCVMRGIHLLTLEGRRHALVTMPGWHALTQLFRRPHQVLNPIGHNDPLGDLLCFPEESAA